jgi:chemotaxis protein methyltransferase CheR
MTAFTALRRFVRENSGLSLEEDKRYLAEDRLQRLMQTEQLANLDELARLVHQAPGSGLATAVIEALTNNETSFFRDRTLFNTVGDQLLPRLMEAREKTRRLRIWCAACSTGQEPYSLAMLIDERIRRPSGWQIEIVASDLSRGVIQTAKQGLYSQFEVQRGLPVAMLLRHFRRLEDHWQISDYMRARISFRVHNFLAHSADLGTFDLIFCRNALIYFDPETKRRALARLVHQLAPDGYLVLGATERVSGLNEDLVPHANYVFARSSRAPLDLAPLAPLALQ